MNTASSFGDQYQEIVIQMVDNGLSESEILKSLEENYSVKISRRTLSRRKEDWGLTNHAAQQIHSLEETITKHFEDGLTYAQIHHAISTSHNYTHSERTMVRQLNSMQLSRRLDDLDRNLTTADMAVSCIMALHQTPEGRNAGYRKMRQLLQTQYGINLHNMTVAVINRTLDPTGVDNRAKRVLKRRVFNTPGPNFIWSADGHDKLKKFGLTIYGFIDAWSRKILGIYVHITNNDPRHIGYYYLQLVKQMGGIPRRTTTDRGAETIHMAGHQINLTEQYNIESTDSSQAHLFTKSTHNQKIECLWSQLMKQFNTELINKLFQALEEEYYSQEDPLQQLLFLYLWVPLLQESLDRWTQNYNSYKRRLDKKTMLPTRCSANWCYNYPEEQGGEQGLIPVPSEAVEALQAAFYPDGVELMRTSPQWFSESIGEILHGMQLEIPVVDVHNVWIVFELILEAIRKFDSAWLSDPTNDPSMTIEAQAQEH
ncbi:hypothetical protein PGT21_023607 [Puccinia graminis f. sp. tritici]|uniref:Integrase catalytic domain-containing protein n=1 Tax=Puccinia graminis f. sp. tritici TaxID=56615 RepID=A0A5B0PY95_PUCGR|nr:hypothetical protein PGT21_023607 [Puccinia graminis f. sp. tritici]KAA1121024.1 hypothetical protein PGTUg99_027663 [Puccinia graminis f. sp. tritici]